MVPALVRPRFLFTSITIAAAACSAGCTSDASRERVDIGLSLIAPKGLIDVDTVKLYVYDKDASSIACNEATISVPPTSADRVFELAMNKCQDTATGKNGWCASGTLEKNADRVLTFYVEGRFNAKPGGFTGCTETAVNQDPMVIAMVAQPLVEGVKCGDAALGLGETCDPGRGATDEACDAAKCQTKEVILSNGKAANRFYRGRPGRKTSVSVLWTPDGHFIGSWSDQATGSSGADGGSEITVRRLTPDLISETSPIVLMSEVRMPDASAGANSDGSKRRGGMNTSPVMVPLGGSNLLAVWAKDDGNVYGSVQRTNFSAAAGADFKLSGSGTGQLSPHAAASSTGDALIAFVEGTTVKTVLRKADGSLSAAQSLGALGTPVEDNRPRVAWVGGAYVVVWGDGNDIKLQRIGSDGALAGTASVANAGKTAGKQDQPDVAAFSTGEFIVVFRDGQGDSGADIRAQRFDKSGAATGTEITAVVNDQQKDGDQGNPVVTAGTSGSGTRFYLVAWSNPTASQIAARFVNVNGGYVISYLGAKSSEFAVGTMPAPRSSPAVAVSDASKGYCAVAWADDTDADAAGDDDRVRVRRIPMPQ